MKKLLLILSLSAIILFGCVQNTTHPTQNNSTTLTNCGDGFCQSNEYCGDCPQDCGCPNGQSCVNGINCMTIK
jgi:hypothetical protein